MTDAIDWATVEEGDTVCWRGRVPGEKWGLVRYTDETHVHVFGAGVAPLYRYPVAREMVTRHFKGRAEYDRRRYI